MGRVVCSLIKLVRILSFSKVIRIFSSFKSEDALVLYSLREED